jgi:CRP-like cAMP-binding protein
MFKITSQRRRFFDPMHSVELFGECSDAELARVMPLLTTVSVPEGQLLTRQGEAGRECFVIVHGDATIERNGVVTARAHAGDIVGELALMDHIPRTATVTTTRPARVLAMSQREFAALRHLGIASVTRRLNAVAEAHRNALSADASN